MHLNSNCHKDTNKLFFKLASMKNSLRIFVPIFLLLSLTLSCTEKKIKIACIGDSITEGAGIEKQNLYSYPSILDSILGDKVDVLNCGRGGSASQKLSDFSYWNTKEFSNLFTYQPNVVIISHGTNDTKSQNWNAKQFELDYQALIDTIKTIPTNPNVILCIPVPIFDTVWGINDSTLQAGVIPILKKLAYTNNLQLIDLNTPLKDKNEFFPDNIHPNENGAREMARIVAREIHYRHNK